MPGLFTAWPTKVAEKDRLPGQVSMTFEYLGIKGILGWN